VDPVGGRLVRVGVPPVLPRLVQPGFRFPRMLPGLLTPESCKEMLERAKPRVAGIAETSSGEFANAEEKRAHMQVSSSDTGTVTNNKKWVEWRGPVRSAHDPAFTEPALAPAMVRGVRRLLGRDRPIRVYHDIFMCKLPDNGSTDTPWHQDSPNFPIDRNALTVWIALDEITPDQGSLQFFSGSHRCGLLGKIPPTPDVDLFDEYPELARFPISAPHHMRPGDATVHHGLTVHGTGANNAGRERWSFAVAYFPGDARYNGAPNHDCDGFDLKMGHTIGHPSFSLVAD
jgi:ectoine hydroxylase-related dioxygenase (phytanoyl-CoA dioxygenase family)